MKQYNPLDMEIVEAIVLDIIDGRGIAQAAEDNGVTYNQLMHWRRTYPEVELLLQGAREAKFERLIEEIVDLATNSPRSTNGVAWTKLQIHAREKAAQLLLPKKYKTSIDVTSDGEKIEPAKITNIEVRLQQLIQIAIQRKEQGALPAPAVEELMQ